MKNEKGFSLIEVLVALALLGIIAGAFLGGLATASKAVLIADKRTTAESLARSQIEYVRNQDYIDYSIEGHEEYQKITTPPPGYSIDLIVEPFDQDTGLPYDVDDGVFEHDDGIQKITVRINHGEEIITLESYRSWR